MIINKIVEESEAVQECYYDKRDWRHCADVLARFRECWIARNKMKSDEKR